MVSLPPDLSSLVQAKVSNGYYRNEEEVLYAALQALSDREEEDLASIRRGLEQADAGEGQPAAKVVSELRAKHGLSDEP